MATIWTTKLHMVLVFDYSILMSLAKICILLGTWQVPMFLTVLAGPIFRIFYTFLTVHVLWEPTSVLV